MNKLNYVRVGKKRGKKNIFSPTKKYYYLFPQVFTKVSRAKEPRTWSPLHSSDYSGLSLLWETTYEKLGTRRDREMCRDSNKKVWHIKKSTPGWHLGILTNKKGDKQNGLQTGMSTNRNVDKQEGRQTRRSTSTKLNTQKFNNIPIILTN